MKKRLLALVLALGIVVTAMTGCGSSPKEIENTTSPKNEIGVGEGVTVEIWNAAWSDERYAPALEKLAEQATAANIGGKGIVVKTNVVAWDNYYDTYLTAATSKTGPTIAAQAGTAPLMYYEMGLALDLMPIYDMWVEEQNPILDVIPQEYFDVNTVDGVLYGIPWGNDSQCMVANTEMLAEAGYEELPTSWDELEQMGLNLKERYPDKEILAVSGGNQAACTSLLNYFLHDYDTGVVSTDLKGNLESTNCMAALNKFEKLFEEGIIAKSSVSNVFADTQRLFLNGDAFFIICSAPVWLVGTDMEEKSAIVPALSNEICDGYAENSLQTYYALKSDHDEETLLVLKWWIENNYLEWSEGGNNVVPARLDYAQDYFADSKIMTSYIETNCTGETRSYVYPLDHQYSFHGALDAEATAGKVLQQIMTGVSAADAAAVCDKEINDLIASYTEE